MESTVGSQSSFRKAPDGTSNCFDQKKTSSPSRSC